MTSWQRWLKPLSSRKMSSNGAHQVKAPLTSEELRLTARWATTFAFPLAVQPVAIGELDIEY